LAGKHFDDNWYFYRCRSAIKIPTKLKALTRLALLGAGNVAHHLSKALRSNGAEFTQVFNRDLSNAQSLAKTLGAEACDDPQDIRSDVDAYLVSLSDDAYAHVLERMGARERLIIHTSGNLGLDVLDAFSQKRGILYPFQSFSKNREIDLKEVPFFIDSNNSEDLNLLRDLGRRISTHVFQLSEEDKQHYHLAAVFANNFANHMFREAELICDRFNLDFKLLHALIRETSAKAVELGPDAAQTGPAIRFDESVLNRHFRELEIDIDAQKIYQIVSESIIKAHSDE
jgi:predicted short-subunit dehydrogenase-like oxidoreductase (DUF2520 family)